MDPFVLNEKDGYFYGRGTHDQKGGAATLVAAFVRLRQEQWVPDRDLILALTADEEGGTVNGVTWLLENRRELDRRPTTPSTSTPAAASCAAAR